MNRALVLIDGEHYPPVTRAAIESLKQRYDVVAAVMLGGKEKIGDSIDVGVPIIFGSSQRATLAVALDAHEVDVVIDCSDEPVIDQRARFTLASVALAKGVSYVGADFALDPPPRPRLTAIPTISVIGTGKRTGKTAVCAALARHLVGTGLMPVIVAMGRGGPAEPVVTRTPPSVNDLLAIADRGEHAASDTYEDAVMAQVTTVGARRAGAGIAGAPLYDTVARAIDMAAKENPDVILLEGSGTAIPPARANATILVTGASANPAAFTDYLGPFRLLISDLVVVTMSEEPVLSSETLAALHSSVALTGRDIPIVRTVFRPEPVASIRGKKTFFATTAPESAGPRSLAHLEEAHGGIMVGITHSLSDRSRLSEDLARVEGTYDVLLTELKAAAIDVAARAARAAGAEVVLCDNVPSGDGLTAAFDSVIEQAMR